jgi:Mg-chelatase subunit ChlD
MAMAAGTVSTTPDGRRAHQWSATIPAEYVDSTGVDYYLESVTPTTVVRSPSATLRPVVSFHHVTAVAPPVPQHVPSPFAADDQPIDVSMSATCSTGTCSATLSYRSSPTSGTLVDEPLTEIPDWPHTAMTQTGAAGLGDAGENVSFRARIPKEVVNTSGVDYFMVVRDGSTRAFWPGTSYQGFLPMDGVRTGYMHVHVLETPHIAHVPVPIANYAEEVPITATANCAEGRDCTARLFWRTTDASLVDDSTGSEGFESAPMVVRANGAPAGGQQLVTVSGVIPEDAVDTRGIDYFFSVSDGATTTWWPGTSQVDGYVASPGVRVGYAHVHVVEPPHIVPLTAPVATPGQTFKISIAASCVTKTCEATAYYGSRDITGAISLEPTQFESIPMTTTGAVADGLSVYEATVPAAAVTTKGLLWYAHVFDGFTNAYAPGTSYVGAYVPVDGSPLPPAGYPSVLGFELDDALPRGTAAFPVRGVEPPHVVHAPPAVARKGQPVDLTATSNCAGSTCSATLTWLDADREEERVEAVVGSVVDGVWTFRFTIPRRGTLQPVLPYRISVSDGWVTDTTPTYPLVTSDEANLGQLGGRVAYDIDEDGAVASHERAMRGVTVKVSLVGLDGLPGTLDDIAVGSDITDADGTWAVSGLVPQGVYGITVDASTVAPGVQRSPGMLRKTRSLSATKLIDRTVDFALPAADIDADGVPDTWEDRFGLPSNSKDTDGDGLTDRFEIVYLLAEGMPNNADTDGDGRPDRAHDPDGDGGTNLQEQDAGTDPLLADTDGDDLTDGDESARATSPTTPDTDGDTLADGLEVRNTLSPLRPDSDGDGIRDDKDVFAVAVARSGTKVTLRGTGDLAGGLQVAPAPPGPATAGSPGQVSDVVQIEFDQRVGQLDSADIAMTYPSSFTGDPADLRLQYFDEEHQVWQPGPATVSVDTTTRTVKGTVQHFSLWAIFDIRNAGQTWTAAAPSCDHPATDNAVDIALVLDSSGSMATNDPERLRVQSAKNFVDSLTPNDRGAVVLFTDTGRLAQGLTHDQTALKAALDTAGSNGGTSLTAGVRTALDALDAAASPSPLRSVILLTDGEGAYDSALSERARSSRVSINTIGLGAGPDEALLRRIAADTGGNYLQVASAAELPEVYRTMESVIDGRGTDNDADGLDDCVEITGMLDGSLDMWFTDPRRADTDGDGVPDGDEVQPVPLGEAVVDLYALEQLGIQVHEVRSDPHEVDSDDDGLPDAYELSEETAAFQADADRDGFSDDEEREHGSDPFERDTDGDGIEDGKDVGTGLGPSTKDLLIKPLEWWREYQEGAWLGDLKHIDSVPQMVGAICSGMIGLIPTPYTVVAGMLIDLRDTIGNLFHKDWWGAGFSGAAMVVPVAGDAAKWLNTVRKFADDYPEFIDDFIAAIGGHAKMDEAARLRTLKAADEATLTALTNAGVSGKLTIELAARGTNLKRLAATLDRMPADRVLRGKLPAGDYLDDAGFVKSWRAGETGLRAYARVTDGTSDVIDGTRYISRAEMRELGIGTGLFRGGRHVDACTRCTRVADRSVLREAKVGRQSLRSRIAKQIEKDKALNDAGVPVEWHFIAGRSGVDLDPKLLDALDAAGIPYYLHLAA